jgi:hypothetical protein
MLAVIFLSTVSMATITGYPISSARANGCAECMALGDLATAHNCMPLAVKKTNQGIVINPVRRK